MDALVLKHTMQPRPISLYEFAVQHPVEVMGWLICILTLLIVLLIYNLTIKTKSNRRIQSLLYRDELTGLDNINKFYGECSRLLNGAKDGGYALLYGDINQFKTINDNCGFAIGDQLLQAYLSVS